jgi:excisionase family DNA binding protein
VSDFGITIGDEFVERVAERVCELLVERQLAAQEPEECWIGTHEAARHLGKPVSRLFDLAAQGAIPHGKDGRSLLFRRSDLDAYVRNGAC